MKRSILIAQFTFILLYILLVNGCKDKFYSTEDFQSVEKIDTHTHINVNDPTLIEQAQEDNFRLLTVNVDAKSYPAITKQREVAIELESRYPNRLSFLTTFSLDGWNKPNAWKEKTIEYLKESFSEGAIGVKVWKNIGMSFKDEKNKFIMINDSQFDPVFDYITKRKKSLLAHIGEPKNCWLPLEKMTVNNDRQYFENHPEYHMYLHPEYPSYEKIIESRDQMLDKHPELSFIGAHLGSMEWSLEMMANHLDKYPNMALDMAHRIPHLQYLTQQDREAVRDFFIKYQDRLMYSTDLQLHADSNPEEVRKLAHDTWREDWAYFVTDDTLTVAEVNGSFQGLKLPKTVVNKLYRENAEKWFPGI